MALNAWMDLARLTYWMKFAYEPGELAAFRDRFLDCYAAETELGRRAGSDAKGSIGRREKISRFDFTEQMN